MNLGFETETLEFKKSTGELKEAINSICAMLNKHHYGELYFGVNKHGEPVGQIVTEESLREVSQKIKNFIEPQIYPEIRRVTIDGKDCIYVKFEGTQVPYFAYGVAKIRVADEDLQMSPEEITNLLLQSGREGNRWENLASNKKVSDVDEDLLRRYTNQAHDVGRIAISYSDRQTVLNQLELTCGENLLNAGKALFSDDITQDLQMAIFATNERLTFTDIQRFHGPVFKLVDIAETYIKNNIHWNVEFDGNMQRKEIPEIPIEAIREALLNSFCHKDYSSGESNEVAIFKDRIEIYNPGSFPEGYEPEDFINFQERPIRRNPKIARILYYSKDIESFGTGLKRIADVCKKYHVGYSFRKLKSGFVVSFQRNSFHDSNSSKKATDKVTDKVADKVTDKPVLINGKILNPKDSRIEIICKYIQENGSISNRETRELLGLSASSAKRLLAKYVSQNILIPKGERKSRIYILADNYK